MPLAVDDDLAETDFGSWEGMSFGEVMAAWPDEMAAWLTDADAAPPGGESFAAVGLRVDAALRRLQVAHQGKTVVVVSHVTPIKTLACRALLAPTAALFRMHLDVASLTEAAWFADGAALLRSLNDTAHLRSGVTVRPQSSTRHSASPKARLQDDFGPLGFIVLSDQVVVCVNTLRVWNSTPRN